MKVKKQIAALVMTGVLAAGGVPAFAAAAPDGYTDAQTTPEAQNGVYAQWQEQWETLKNDWTQVSLSPGADQTQMNFAWYSTTRNVAFRVATDKEMSQSVQQVTVQGTEGPKDKTDTQYYSCKATASNLTPGTYYYQIGDGEPVAFEVQDSSDGFSFIYVGDPQIGSSNELKGTDTAEFYAAQSASVCNDSFNWNNTLEKAVAQAPDASFVLSAGDQIQTNAKKAPNKDATNSEIEYAGYLCPEVLDSLPVATTVGNHDADNPNYTYHFNTANNSELGSNGIVGGDYYYTYGNALFIMLNTQDTNVAEHKQFIEQAVAACPDAKWRIVTLHQDIYGSAEHSNEPEITNLRYQLVPYFEENDIDVVLTGHDHAYSRSQILKGGVKTTEYTDDAFDEMLEKDMDAGENPETRFIAPENIIPTTTEPAEQAYLQYLDAVMDKEAVEETDGSVAVNPEGILYMTANSSSGSKYYDLVPRMQSYIANRWQEDVPTYSVIDIDEDSFTINTYRTDTDEKIDDTFTIVKNEQEEVELPFTDVSKDAWYYDAVAQAYQDKLFLGTSTTTFSPEKNMSRAMFVQVLYNMNGQPKVEGTLPFTDVKKSDWYYDAVLWAYQNKVTAGVSDTKFAPMHDVTREQTAVLLEKYTAANGKDTSARGDLSRYSDADSISTWAKDAVSWAVANKIMVGTDTGKLLPGSNASRAQAAQIMVSYRNTVQ
ncbi:S-layer homology domain-containing protein [Butyricicoccus sp.]|uniref:S-layer homology domain-containing protein n=1 Tax=Butyricicoccus sp. TaxID=2049021 RepID=UPI003F15383D